MTFLRRLYIKLMGMYESKVFTKVWWSPIFKLIVKTKCNLVLDLGCGSGWATLYLKNQVFECIGLDIDSSRLIEEVRKYFILADAHNPPFRANVFDCVIAFSVLEHLKKPSRALNEVYRVLKLKGIFIATIPTPKLKPKLSGHEDAWFFESKEWIKLFKSSGFRHVSMPLELYLDELDNVIKSNKLKKLIKRVPLCIQNPIKLVYGIYKRYLVRTSSRIIALK